MLCPDASGVGMREWPIGIVKKGWLANEITKELITIQLSDEHLLTIVNLMEKTKKNKIPITSMTQLHFNDQSIVDLMMKAVTTLKFGYGLVIIRGIPVDSFDIEDIKRIYVGLSLHFGQLVSQSRFGELVGENFVKPDGGRGVHRLGPLPLHNDPIEILSLCCVRKAASGGENKLVSSLKVWEIVEREHPEYLPILYRGFRVYLAGEQRVDQREFTSEPVPIFSVKDGLRSCWMNINSVELLAEARGELMTDEERAAIRYVLSVIKSEELSIKIQLEPGEMIYINNFEVMHSRLHFTESEDPNNFRYLLRLWLQDTPARPMINQLNIHQNKSGLQGIDAQHSLPKDEYSKVGENFITKMLIAASDERKSQVANM